MTRDPKDLLADFRPPSAPEGLRQRVLAAAATEPERAIRQPTTRLTDRLWENRSLRLAWAAMVAILLSAHLVLADGTRSSRITLAGSEDSRKSRTDGSRLAAGDRDLLRFLSRHPKRQPSVAARNLRAVDLWLSSPPAPPSTPREGGSV